MTFSSALIQVSHPRYGNTNEVRVILRVSYLLAETRLENFPFQAEDDSNMSKFIEHMAKFNQFFTNRKLKTNKSGPQGGRRLKKTGVFYISRHYVMLGRRLPFC